MLASILRTLSVSISIVLTAGLGCRAAPEAERSPSLAFRPVREGAQLWLTTPFAVELTNERDARAIEAVDAMYVGELGSREGRARLSVVAAVAAERGATHFRVVTAADAHRVDVLLYRVPPERWRALPESLRPTPPS